MARITWQDLLRPVSAEFFCVDSRVGGRPPLPRVEPRFDSRVGWWMAELSRWVYFTARGEAQGGGEENLREEVLNRVAWREDSSFSEAGTHAAILSPPARSPDRDRPWVVVFRGSRDLTNWFTNLDVSLVEWTGKGRVHRGFADALDRVWDPLVQRLDDLPDREVVFTGHSLGGALATLAGVRRRPRAVYTFGAPKVGDRRFATQLGKLPLSRVVHGADVVVSVPPSVGDLDYAHGGTEVRLERGPGDEGSTGSFEAFGSKESGSERSVWGFDPERLVTPPAPLADHAPIGYVLALLARVAGEHPSR